MLRNAAVEECLGEIRNKERHRNLKEEEEELWG